MLQVIKYLKIELKRVRDVEERMKVWCKEEEAIQKWRILGDEIQSAINKLSS